MTTNDDTQQAENQPPSTEYVPPIYSIVVAVDASGGYAKGGEIPWHYSADLKWFNKVTMGTACIMGRLTYEGINRIMGDKGLTEVLPGRQSFVVSDTLESLPNAQVVRSMHAARLALPGDYNKPIHVIGGGRLFVESIAIASSVHLTIINKTFGCDKFFPVDYLSEHFSPPRIFKAEDEPDLRFLVYNRK